MMRFDFETYLPEDVLTKVDRMSMAHSIESRVPLLDNHVIDFAATLPSDLKIRDGRRKHILKEAVRTLLPPGIIDRKKQGFGVPLGVWFRGGLTDVFSDVLASPRTRQRGYFEPGFVDRMVHEHLSGRRDHTLRLWQLMIFELWHRHYLDEPVALPRPGRPRNKCSLRDPGCSACRLRLIQRATHEMAGLSSKLSRSPRSRNETLVFQRIRSLAAWHLPC